MSLLNFDKEQLQMYKKIRSVRSKVDNLKEQDKLTEAVRRLKQAQMRTDRNKDIYRENRRLYNQILSTNVRKQETIESHQSSLSQTRPSIRASSLHRSVSRGKRIQAR